MKISELVFFIAFGAVATFVLTIMLRDWFRQRQIRRRLASRNQSDDDQFRTFFSNAQRADIAIRTRRVLENNLQLPLLGLTPNDRLQDGLNAELPANPHLFWELEAEFGIKTDVEDLARHEKTLERLVTFQDLVEYVEQRIAARSTEPPVVDADAKSSRLYDFAMRSLPVLFIGGLVTAVVGILIQKRSLMNLGGLIFLSGAAAWGLANGGEMLRNMVRSGRGSTWKEIVARPWPWIVLTGFALFFLWFGGIAARAILKNLLSSK